MSLLFTSQLRFLARAPWSAATALVGVALGVASVVAVHLIGAEVQRSLEDATPPHLAALTHVATASDADADAYFRLRDAWRRQPDSPIRALVPMVEGQAPGGAGPVRVIGVDWLALPAGAGGPGGSADVLLGRAVIADAALRAGGAPQVSVGDRTLQVAATVETGLGTAVFADIALAQRLLDAPPSRVDRVGITLRDPWARWRDRLDALMPGFGAGLPEDPGGAARRAVDALAGHQGVAWTVRPVAAERPSAALARSVLFNLGALGTLALLVAWFLIHQVAVIWLRRQRLVFERLVALGAAPARLRRAFVTLLGLVGLSATLIGLAAGVVLAWALMGLSAAATDVSLAAGAGRALDPWLLGKAVLSGFGICLLGGYGAFAGALAEPGGGAVRWRRWLVPLLGAVMVGGIVFDATGVLGGFAAILALSLLGVAAVGPVLAGLRRRADRRRGARLRLLDRLAVREVAWYPRLLSVALAALTLAVATSIGIAVMVESFRIDFARMLDLRLAGDLYVYDSRGLESEEPGSRLAPVAGWLEAHPDVRRISRSGQADARVGGLPVEVGFARMDALEAARYRHGAPLAPGEALVSERLARDLEVGIGDVLPRPAGGLTVVGLFPGFGDPAGRVVVDLASLPRLGLEPRLTRLSVDLRADADPAALAAALTARFPALTAEPRRSIRARALDIFDRTFAITQALALLALTVAVVGTYNALVALRLQQAPTVRLLEAQGVGRRALARLSLVRAGTVGAIAALLALPLGLAMAWALCAVVNPRAFGWTVSLHLPVAGWLPPLVLGFAAALLAGALPAPRERGGDHGDG